MPSKPSVVALLYSEKVQELIVPLECDGASTVLSAVLSLHDISHYIVYGKLRLPISPNYIPHIWLMLNDKYNTYIDYKSKLWNMSAPAGFFLNSDYHVVNYSKFVTKLVAADRLRIANILTQRNLELYF